MRQASHGHSSLETPSASDDRCTDGKPHVVSDPGQGRTASPDPWPPSNGNPAAFSTFPAPTYPIALRRTGGWGGGVRRKSEHEPNRNEANPYEVGRQLRGHSPDILPETAGESPPQPFRQNGGGGVLQHVVPVEPPLRHKRLSLGFLSHYHHVDYRVPATTRGEEVTPVGKWSPSPRHLQSHRSGFVGEGAPMKCMLSHTRATRLMGSLAP